MADVRRHSAILPHSQNPPFRCTICHFSFPKQSLFDQHYHEHHQLSNQSVPYDTGIRTPIACLHCAKAKTKCDKRIPCGRCARRDLHCQSRPTRRTIYTDTPYSNIEPRRPQSGHYDARWALDPAQNQPHGSRRRSMADQSERPQTHSSSVSAADASARASISTIPNGTYHSELAGYIPGAYQTMSNGYGAASVPYTQMASSTVPRDAVQGHANVTHYGSTSMATSHDVQYANTVTAAPGYGQTGLLYSIPMHHEQMSMGYDMYSHSQAPLTSPTRYSARESVGGAPGTPSWPYYPQEAAPSR